MIIVFEIIILTLVADNKTLDAIVTRTQIPSQEIIVIVFIVIKIEIVVEHRDRCVTIVADSKRRSNLVHTINYLSHCATTQTPITQIHHLFSAAYY